MPATVLRALHVLGDWVLTATLWGKYYHPHFTGETKPRGSEIACPRWHSERRMVVRIQTQQYSALNHCACDSPCVPELPEGLVDRQTAGPSHSIDLEWGSILVIFNKFQGDAGADAAGPGTILWELLSSASPGAGDAVVSGACVLCQPWPGTSPSS